jgi:hypothetical protein
MKTSKKRSERIKESRQRSQQRRFRSHSLDKAENETFFKTPHSFHTCRLLNTPSVGTKSLASPLTRTSNTVLPFLSKTS